MAPVILCTLLLLLSLLSWLCSYLPDHFSLRTSRGALVFLFHDQNVASAMRSWSTADAINSARVWDTRTNSMGFLGFELVFTSGQLDSAFFIVAVPFWFITLLLALGTAASILSLRKHRRWNKEGRCPSCGYDIRITPDHCPECGWRMQLPAAGAQQV